MLKKMLTLVIAAVPLCLVWNMSIAGKVTFVNKAEQKVYVCPFPITRGNIDENHYKKYISTGTSQTKCGGVLFTLKAGNKITINYTPLAPQTKNYIFYCSNGKSLTDKWANGDEITLKAATCNN